MDTVMQHRFTGPKSSSAGDVLAVFRLGDGARPTGHDRTTVGR